MQQTGGFFYRNSLAALNGGICSFLEKLHVSTNSCVFLTLLVRAALSTDKGNLGNLDLILAPTLQNMFLLGIEVKYLQIELEGEGTWKTVRY